MVLLSGPRLSILTALLATIRPPIPITVRSLAQATGYYEGVVTDALAWLAKPTEKDVRPFIGMNDTEIWVAGWVTGTKIQKLPFAMVDPRDHTASYETEFRRLHRQIEQLRQDYDEEDLPPSDDEIELFQTTREILGRQMTRTEAYHLGKLAGSGFAVSRITLAIEKFAKTKSPVRTAYAVMKRNGLGKPADIKAPPAEAKYWQAPANFDPWS